MTSSTLLLTGLLCGAYGALLVHLPKLFTPIFLRFKKRKQSAIKVGSARNRRLPVPMMVVLGVMLGLFVGAIVGLTASSIGLHQLEVAQLSFLMALLPGLVTKLLAKRFKASPLVPSNRPKSTRTRYAQ